MLYVTYVVDKILKKLNEMDTDKGLQEQVDKYFVDGEKSYPGIERTDND